VWIWISRVLKASIGLVVLLIAFVLYSYLAGSRAAPAHTESEATLRVVRAVRVVPHPIAMHWSGYGTARALSAADVAAQVAGRVVQRPAGLEAGVPVSKGDLLAQIDPRDYQARLRGALRLADSFDAQISALEIEEARLGEQADLLLGEMEIATRELERARTAEQRGAGNQSAVDSRLQSLNALSRAHAAVLSQLEIIPSRTAQLRASLDSARADQQIAADNLERTAVRAPFDGVVQSIGINIGEWARAGDTIARVVDLSVIEVPLSIPQSAAGRIAVGDLVDLNADGADSLRWPGSIGRIAPESDASVRSMTVFVEVRQRPDADSRTLLRPGQFVMGAIVSGDVSEAVVVPRRSVNDGRVLVASAYEGASADVPAGVRTPMVIREAEVDITHYIEHRFESISPSEMQWAVLRTVSKADPRGIRPGDIVLTSNLEMLRVGELIDVRFETEQSDQARAPTDPKIAPKDDGGTP